MSVGVAVPIFLAPVLPSRLHVIFTVLKQFGTGVIISTAMVHVGIFAMEARHPC